jgi:putative membrane fusion protein
VTRKGFLQKYALRIAVTMAMLGLIVYTVAHAMGFAMGNVLTTPVRRITDTQITSAEGYLFRNEEVLTTTTEGLVDPLVENGTKVGKNVSVAKVWSTDKSGDALAAAQLQLSRINRSIRILEESQLKAGTPLSEANKYRAEYTALYREISAATEEGKLDQIPVLEEKLLIALNRYVSLIGDTDETRAHLQSLRQEKETLIGAASATEIKSETSSGLFYESRYVDGFEDAFSMTALEELTPEGLHTIVESTPTLPEGQTVGKLVYGYEWYLALELSPSVAAGFGVGREYRFAFPENNGATAKLTLEKTVVGDGTVLAVFRCESHPNDFLFYRKQTVEITVGETEGFYIPETALVSENGIMGVYVFEESTVRFRQAHIIWMGEGYAIAKLPGEGSLTELQENDILIVSGNDLYEGKVYR